MRYRVGLLVCTCACRSDHRRSPHAGENVVDGGPSLARVRPERNNWVGVVNRFFRNAWCEPMNIRVSRVIDETAAGGKGPRIPRLRMDFMMGLCVQIGDASYGSDDGFVDPQRNSFRVPDWRENQQTDSYGLQSERQSGSPISSGVARIFQCQALKHERSPFGRS